MADGDVEQSAQELAAVHGKRAADRVAENTVVDRPRMFALQLRLPIESSNLLSNQSLGRPRNPKSVPRIGLNIHGI